MLPLRLESTISSDFSHRTCISHNVILNKDTVERILCHLQVYYFVEHPRARLTPKNITDVIGSRVTYLCEASPVDPAPLLTWILPGRGQFTESNATLEVEVGALGMILV